MREHTGWPHQIAPHHQANGAGPDISGGINHDFLLGQLSAGQGIIMERMSRQDHVLDRIDLTLQEKLALHHSHDKRLTVLETAKPSSAQPALEVWIKYAATLAVPLATLWATGSVDKAVEVFKAMGGAGH